MTRSPPDVDRQSLDDIFADDVNSFLHAFQCILHHVTQDNETGRCVSLVDRCCTVQLILAGRVPLRFPRVFLQLRGEFFPLEGLRYARTAAAAGAVFFQLEETADAVYAVYCPTQL